MKYEHLWLWVPARARKGSLGRDDEGEEARNPVDSSSLLIRLRPAQNFKDSADKPWLVRPPKA